MLFEEFRHLRETEDESEWNADVPKNTHENRGDILPDDLPGSVEHEPIQRMVAENRAGPWTNVPPTEYGMVHAVTVDFLESFVPYEARSDIEMKISRDMLSKSCLRDYQR
jgi:hypothetical protein